MTVIRAESSVGMATSRNARPFDMNCFVVTSTCDGMNLLLVGLLLLVAAPPLLPATKKALGTRYTFLSIANADLSQSCKR